MQSEKRALRAVAMLSPEERATMIASYRGAIREQCVKASIVLATQGRRAAMWHWKEAMRFIECLGVIQESSTGVIQ